MGLRHGLGMGLRHGLEDGLGLRHGLEAWGREGWLGLRHGGEGWLGLNNEKKSYSVRLETNLEKRFQKISNFLVSLEHLRFFEICFRFVQDLSTISFSIV